MTHEEDAHPVEEGQVVDIVTKRLIDRAADVGLVPVDEAAGPDAETIDPVGDVVGGPVDAPDERQPIYATVTRSADQARQPIVPAWLRNSQQRRQFARAMAGTAGYVAAFHTVRSPKYAVLAAFWAIVGVFRVTGRQIRWWWVLEQHSLRQDAANKNDAFMWIKLHNEAKKTRLWRGIVLGFEVACLAVAAVLVAVLAPAWVAVALALALVPALARWGRPADKPIVDRVTSGPRFVKLTAEMVRTALCSLGIAGIREPGSVSFPPPGIHRDGPGWLARVNLPQGVEAVDVLERRGRLSSALRLPVDQVWPTAGPEHAGQLDVWVGYAPASKMGQPTWSLTSPTARTSVFDPHEFGTDERMRAVTTVLFARNFLIGGVPGSGKSYAARALTIIAALDPTAELKIAEFKGTGDFGDLAHLCSTYVCGVDDAAFAVGMDILAYGLAEAERRAKRLLKARELGLAPEGKVTPELARTPGSGLHPLVITIDEAHELFGDATVGKEAAIAAERLIKRGRALGIVVILATQIPDAKSLPPAITRCVNVRWCLAVQDHIANDMILGTGAYKRGQTATVYRPGEDAGWGVMTGLSAPTSVHSHFPDPDTNAAIVARATALRGGVVGEIGEGLERRDVLDDVRSVFYAGEVFASWQQIAARLAEKLPEHYAEITGEAVSARLRAAGVASVDGKARGEKTTKKGARREAVAEAIDRRALTAGRG